MSAVDLPVRLEAHEPPEARGVARDSVRLLVSSRRRARSSTAAFVTCRGSLLRRPARHQHVGHASPRPYRRCAPTAPNSSSGSPPRRPAAIPTATGSWSYAAETSRSAPSGRGGPRAPGAATARIVAPYAAPRLWLAHLELPRRRLRPISPSTGNRSVTATCRSAGHSPRTRTSTPLSPVAPRCRARGDPSQPS